LSTSQRNLQSVIEEFQVSSEMEQSIVLKELDSAKADAAKATAYQEECLKWQRTVEERDAEKEELLKQQKSDRVEVLRLQSETRGLSAALQEALRKLKAQNDESGMIDKRFVVMMLLNYFKVKGGEKLDVLRVIAKHLDFTEEEEEAVGLRTAGWFSWFGARESGTRAAAHVNPEEDSIGDLFQQFLMNESALAEVDAKKKSLPLGHKLACATEETLEQPFSVAPSPEPSLGKPLST